MVSEFLEFSEFLAVAYKVWFGDALWLIDKAWANEIEDVSLSS